MSEPPPVRPANFNDAIRRGLEAELQCPKCHEMNRPGVVAIALDSRGVALCSVCATSWKP